ncbi:patatin-like phospholipase domain-containing protein 4 isoform X2 [Symsagittifera roscoffensis]
MIQRPLSLGISFSGAGFLGIYHFGVIAALKKHANSLVNKISRYAGASAGSLAACIMAVAPEKLDDAKTFLIATGEHINQLKRGPLNRDYDIMMDLETYLRKSLPEDAYVKADGRLFVSLTSAVSISKISNIVSSSYTSNDHLIQCLLASCYIPMYAKSDAPSLEHPDSDGIHRTTRMIDGGFTDNLPLFHDIPTISVSPFSGNTDISPNETKGSPRLLFTVNKLPVHLSAYNIRRGVHALFPPRKEVLIEYYDLGFSDCVDYLKRTKEYDKI